MHPTSALLSIVLLLSTSSAFAAPTSTKTHPLKRDGGSATGCVPDVTTVHDRITNVVTVTSPATWAGSCLPTTQTTSSTTSTTSCITGKYGYGSHFTPNITWQPSCHIMEFCNGANFNGTCVSIYREVNSGPNDDHCTRLGTVGGCLMVPAFGYNNTNFTGFQHDYGESLQTLSIRPGDNLTCATFLDSSCQVPAIPNFTDDRYSNLSEYNLPNYFGSFQCWPDTEWRPNIWGSTTTSYPIVPYTTILSPTMSSMMPATSISVPMASATPYETALGPQYFDPFIDQLLVCGEDNATQCVAWNATKDGCDTLYDVALWFGLSTVEYAAAGFGQSCVLYDDPKCSHALATVSGPDPTTISPVSATTSLPAWYFNCQMTQCPEGPKYSECTAQINPTATTIDTTFNPLPVMTRIVTWSFSGAPSTTSPSPVWGSISGSSPSASPIETVISITTTDSNGYSTTSLETTTITSSATGGVSSSTVIAIVTTDSGGQTITTLQTTLVPAQSTATGFWSTTSMVTFTDSTGGIITTSSTVVISPSTTTPTDSSTTMETSTNTGDGDATSSSLTGSTASPSATGSVQEGSSPTPSPPSTTSTVAATTTPVNPELIVYSVGATNLPSTEGTTISPNPGAVTETARQSGYIATDASGSTTTVATDWTMIWTLNTIGETIAPLATLQPSAVTTSSTVAT